ncbi:hypothetical protein ACH5RR_014293 [Cinchona calisaya]|uniref:EF-hand domain-containing protein n=1 Tax=Cinchona calisaya TaxID=153742 RepID=A0ABD3A2G2_9GENT
MYLNSGLNQLPIEYISLDNTIPLGVVILGFLQVCLCIILDWDNKIYSFFLGSKPSTSSIQEKAIDNKLKIVGEENEKKEKNQDSELLKKNHDDSMCGEDVELVFRSLGFLSHANNDGEKTFEERLDCNDLFDLFEEKEPGEDEVKAAFDVFDENKDGFIDARELQKLLFTLGLREGSELENCRRMIRVFDENGDERIDLNEFIKIMESSFC